MPEFGNYDPSNFGWKVPSSYTPFTYKGVNFPQGVASPDVAKLFTMALDALVPRIPHGLVNGWCWGGENRNIAGTSRKSFHAFGLAIDLNAPANPHGTRYSPGNNVLPSNTGAIVKPFGIEWGGDWDVSSLDRMHLGVHLTPAEVKKLVDAKTGPSVPDNTYDTYYHGQPATRTIQKFSSGDDVKSLQDTLNQWYPSHKQLSVDGFFGSLTDDFVRYYQKRAKLEVDGIVGRKTWAGLGYNVRY